MKHGRFAVLVAAIALMAAIPSPAQAKGIGGVTVRAEDGRSEFLDGENAAYGLAVSTHVGSAVFRTDPRILVTTLPQGALGPRFTLLWDLGFEQPIRQDAYPLAEEGPVTFVPPDQPLGGDPTSNLNRTFGGWFRADPDLGAVLESLGFAFQAQDLIIARWDGAVASIVGITAHVMMTVPTTVVRGWQRYRPV